jgi:hypothetical protein
MCYVASTHAFTEKWILRDVTYPVSCPSARMEMLAYVP